MRGQGVAVIAAKEKGSLKRRGGKSREQNKATSTSDLVSSEVNYSLPNLHCKKINYGEIWQS